MNPNSTSMTTRVFLQFKHPAFLVCSIVLIAGTVLGLLILTTHSLIQGYGKMPLIAWHWCLPLLLVIAGFNVQFNYFPNKLSLRWCWLNIPLQRHHTILNASSVAWVDLGQKGKTFSLVSTAAPSKSYLTLTRPAAQRLSTEMHFFFDSK